MSRDQRRQIIEDINRNVLTSTKTTSSAGHVRNFNNSPIWVNTYAITTYRGIFRMGNQSSYSEDVGSFDGETSMFNF